MQCRAMTRVGEGVGVQPGTRGRRREVEKERERDEPKVSMSVPKRLTLPAFTGSLLGALHEPFGAVSQGWPSRKAYSGDADFSSITIRMGRKEMRER